jgi:hypothetical protein
LPRKIERGTNSGTDIGHQGRRKRRNERYLIIMKYITSGQEQDEKTC